LEEFDMRNKTNLEIIVSILEATHSCPGCYGIKGENEEEIECHGTVNCREHWEKIVIKAVKDELEGNK
jgi:hypothetical protein